MIKKFKIFENKDIDPYGEEQWDDPYNGNIIEFLKSIKDPNIKMMVDDLMKSDELDEMIALTDMISAYVKSEFPELYPLVKGDIQHLVL